MARPPDVSANPALSEGIRLAVATLRTPVGSLQVTASQDRLLAIELPGQQAAAPVDKWLAGRLLSRRRTPALRQALDELRQYFGGRRRRFDIRVAPSGTEFQHHVWQAIARIPYGETITYGEIAVGLGGLHLARAVGAATGANPIPIIIPCHRVIGADGSMTGYGGGLKMKIWLLRHERALLA